MQWSATKSGKHAVVGYNARGILVYNHPASGFDFIVSTVGTCSQRAKRDIVFEFSTDEGNIGGELNEAYQECVNLANCDGQAIDYEEMEDADKMIPKCPPSFYQTYDDYRFAKQPGTGETSTCFVWVFAFETKDTGTGSRHLYTRQCCYDVN